MAAAALSQKPAMASAGASALGTVPERDHDQEDDDRWMTAAIEAARRGRPSPNPHVGAVLVRSGRILGLGHHERAGGDHAEVAALKNAGAEVRGSTLYVTLEPCNHFGRTPPCTQAIIAAGIRRVVIGACDPNPVVVGGGERVLREAGIDVVVGVRADSAEQLVAAWSKVQTTKAAHVTLDVREDAREGGASLPRRNDFDALLFDAETVRELYPRVTDAPSPLWVLFDPPLERLDDLAAAAAATRARWLVVTTPESLLRLGPSLSALATSPTIDWLPTKEPVSSLPTLLARRGVVTVLGMVGHETARQLLHAGAVDGVVRLDD